MSVAPLVLPAHLVEPLELARWDVAEDDDGPPRPLTVPEDALQPTELARGVLQVLHMFVGLVPEVGVQTDQGQLGCEGLVVEAACNSNNDTPITP